jgi:outer membrane protein
VQSWFNHLSARARVTAAASSLQAAEETAKAARQRQQIGVATREDELQAETALAQARLILIQREGELAASAGQLAIVAGYPADTVIRLDFREQELDLLRQQASAQPPQLSQLMTLAQTRRPDLIAQQRRLDASQSELDRIAAQARPSLTLSATTASDRNELSQRDGGQLALTARLPLFTGFQQRHLNALAASQRTEQDIELTRIQQQVSLDVWLAWQQLNTARARIDATDSLLTAATESNRAALARYRAGLGNLLNVLTAQSNLAEAQQQHATARFDFANARLSLAQASGLLVRDATLEMHP